MLVMVVLVGWVMLSAYAEAIAVRSPRPLATTRHSLCEDAGPAPWQGVYTHGMLLSIHLRKEPCPPR